MTPKQSLFIAEYLKDLNGTQAAIRAGYSEKTAYRAAYQLLNRPDVQEEINKAMAERAARIEIDADRVLQEIAAMAFFDAGEVGAAGISAPKDLHKLPPHLRRAVVGWSWDRTGRFIIKFADKLAALEKLGKHLKLFTERHEHTGADGGPIEVINASAADFDGRLAGLVARYSADPAAGGTDAG